MPLVGYGLDEKMDAVGFQGIVSLFGWTLQAAGAQGDQLRA